jgi:hypothetical protein
MFKICIIYIFIKESRSEIEVNVTFFLNRGIIVFVYNFYCQRSVESVLPILGKIDVFVLGNEVKLSGLD